MGRAYVPDLVDIKKNELSEDQCQRYENVIGMLLEKYGNLKLPSVILIDALHPFDAYFDSSEPREIYFYVANNDGCDEVSKDEYNRAIEMKYEISQQFIKDFYNWLEGVIPQ